MLVNKLFKLIQKFGKFKEQKWAYNLSPQKKCGI